MASARVPVAEFGFAMAADGKIDRPRGFVDDAGEQEPQPSASDDEPASHVGEAPHGTGPFSGGKQCLQMGDV